MYGDGFIEDRYTKEKSSEDLVENFFVAFYPPGSSSTICVCSEFDSQEHFTRNFERMLPY